MYKAYEIGCLKPIAVGSTYDIVADYLDYKFGNWRYTHYIKFVKE